jgi:hypothetical protein
MKIEISGWLYVQPDKYDEKGYRVIFAAGDSTAYWVESGYIPVCQHTIDVDAPEIDIVGGQIQCLLAQREKLTKEYENATSRIDDTLAKLKCLTFDSKGVAA